MTTLDNFWSQIIDQAIKNADIDGRENVAEFLRLRSKNDAIRQTAVTWLLDTFTSEIMTTESISRGLVVERVDTHHFKHENSNLIGSHLSFQLGVRCLSVEAGWTRTPSDGIMTGGALARARISHFGFARAKEEFLLILEQPRPRWRQSETAAFFDTSILTHHLDLLIA